LSLARLLSVDSVCTGERWDDLHDQLLVAMEVVYKFCGYTELSLLLYTAVAIRILGVVFAAFSRTLVWVYDIYFQMM
jgi:hypothetical protein